MLQTACPICQFCGADGHIYPESPVAFEIGEVFQIQDSVWTPISAILADAKLTGLSGEALRRSCESLHDLLTREHATNKLRPCILMNGINFADNPEGISHPHVCLIATFEGTPITELPKIMQFFCIPIMPHADLSAFAPHLHSSPEWQVAGAWIIAWRYASRRELGERWRLPNGYQGDRSGMAFGRSAMRILMDICDEKKDRWKRQCMENPAMVYEYEAEYRLHRQNHRSRCGSLASTPKRRPRSRGSRESAAPYGNAYAQSRRSVLSHTILEDEVASFHAPQRVHVLDESRERTSRHAYTPRTSSGSDKLFVASATSGRSTQEKKGLFKGMKRRFTPLRKASSGDA